MPEPAPLLLLGTGLFGLGLMRWRKPHNTYLHCMGIARRTLELLQRPFKLRPPRCITILVDPDADKSAAHAIVQQLNPGPRDVVIYRAHHGGYDLNLPRLLAVTTRLR